MDNIIEINSLRRTFRDFWLRPTVNAVDGIDLTVNRGEVFGLLGPNGSGKSTMAKLIAGITACVCDDGINQWPVEIAIRKRIHDRKPDGRNGV